MLSRNSVSNKVKVISKQRVAEIDSWVQLESDSYTDVAHQIQDPHLSAKEESKESVYEVWNQMKKWHIITSKTDIWRANSWGI